MKYQKPVFSHQYLNVLITEVIESNAINIHCIVLRSLFEALKRLDVGENISSRVNTNRKLISTSDKICKSTGH